MIDFISDDECECSITWHYSMNAAEQYIKLLDVDSFKRCIAIENMKGQGKYRTAKDDNGSKKW